MVQEVLKHPHHVGRDVMHRDGRVTATPRTVSLGQFMIWIFYMCSYLMVEIVLLIPTVLLSILWWNELTAMILPHVVWGGTLAPKGGTWTYSQSLDCHRLSRWAGPDTCLYLEVHSHDHIVPHPSWCLPLNLQQTPRRRRELDCILRGIRLALGCLLQTCAGAKHDFISIMT